MISDTTWFVLLIIFPALMAIFFIYQLVATSFARKREAKMKEEQQQIKERIFLESLIIIETVVELNHKTLENFVPSLSETKMFEIQKRAKETLNYFFHKNKFFFSFMLLIREEESFVEKLTKRLHSVKSNLWEKYLVEELKELKEKVADAKNGGPETFETLKFVLTEVVQTRYYGQKDS